MMGAYKLGTHRNLGNMVCQRAGRRTRGIGTYLTVDRGRGIEIEDIYGDHYEGGHTGEGVNLPGEHVGFFPLEYRRTKKSMRISTDPYRPPVSETLLDDIPLVAKSGHKLPTGSRKLSYVTHFNQREAHMKKPSTKHRNFLTTAEGEPGEPLSSRERMRSTHTDIPGNYSRVVKIDHPDGQE
jgi:hypothetical protein